MRFLPCCVALVLASPLIAQPWSIEKEAALGKQLAAEFEQRTTRFGSAIVQEYADRIAERLLAQIPEAVFPVTLRVVSGDGCPYTYEPVALPGGYLFVPAGLFLAAQDEAEFAGMLAHAMAHAVRRRGPRSAPGAAKLASVPLIFVGGWSTPCAPNAIPLAWQQALRKDELEADAVAVKTMARAGFDPAALARYWERASRLRDREERVAALSNSIDNQPAAANTAARPEEFAAAQREVRRLSEAPQHRTPPSLFRKAK